MTREDLAAALPCDDPEEACDTDGRDAHRWCDKCIARWVINDAGLSVVSTAEMFRLRGIEFEADDLVTSQRGRHARWVRGSVFDRLRDALEGPKR